MWILVTTAMAADPPSSGNNDDWGFDTKSDISIEIEDEDDRMVDFAAAERRKPPAPTHFHVSYEGQKPLADAWDPWVVATNERYVVVQLPVLVATDRASFVAAHPHGLTVIGEWTSGSHALTVQHHVTAASVLPSDPTFVFLQTALPNRKRADQYRVVVKTRALPDPALPVDPEQPPVRPKVRYARSSAYSRP
ncbi:MAG: hypothetical protein KTR31_38240 [Myxococcales bacterium]|nr:hypothetical protein [Myxococcales bacterium]